MKQRENTTEVKSQKTDEEFIGDLTTTTTAVLPDELGKVTVSGAFPQVIRKPIVRTEGGFTRTSY